MYLPYSSFHVPFQSREQIEVTGAGPVNSGRGRGEQLVSCLQRQRDVGRCVVVVEEPKVRHFLPDVLPHALQNLQVELLIGCLAWKNNLLVHTTSAVE